jgi:Glycosyl transferases group 1
MTDELPRRSVVILSTTPPIPRDYGNRNRVFQTLALFRKLDFAVSFLLYPFDKDWEAQIPIYYKELASSFDFFAVIPNSRPLHQPARAYHHDIDEWWDDNIGQYLNWLFSRHRFDVFLVNYTFLSKAFDYTPPNVFKILDTHDLFSGRRETFEKNGVAAEFFYTSQQQESIGFDRSDLIFAIKQSEQQVIEQMTEKPVVCLPYWDDRIVPRSVAAPNAVGYDHERPLRLGFIGAYNSVNIINLRRFLETLVPYVKLYNLPIEILMAGNVCQGIDQSYAFLRKIGFVEDIAEFYNNIDIIIAPLEFSTGIKIKVGEALARGIPVLATGNAFDGFRPYHATQNLPDLASVCEAIVSAAYGELPLAELATAAQKAAIAAARTQDKALAIIGDRVVAALRRLLLIVDRPFWSRETFLDEMVSQSIEFLSQITPVVVCCISEDAVVPKKLHAKADYIRITALEDLSSIVRDRVLADYSVVGTVVIAAAAKTEEAAICQLKALGVAPWSLSLAGGGINTRIVLRDTFETQPLLELAPLRYLPTDWPVDIQGRNYVSLFVPDTADEWAQLARGYVEHAAVEFGIAVHTAPIPIHHETDPVFFKMVGDLIGQKCILIVHDAFSPAFVLQILKFWNIPFLLLNSDFICPEYLAAQGMPSLEGSVRAFLDGKHRARTQAGPDTGWSAVFREFSEPRRVPAFPFSGD